MTDEHAPAPRITRVRHELRRRELTVEAVERLTPYMLRIAVTGDDLADFTSLGADDHIKLFIDGPDGAPQMRDYTPRLYDTAARRLVIDFAVHEAGPATAWGLAAKTGDRLTIGGPRGSAVYENIESWVLVGDETALPAIGRRIEEAAPETRIVSVVAVPGEADRQHFSTPAHHRAHWVHRPLSQATDASGLIAALAGVDLTDKTFVWIAAEASVARAVRAYIQGTRGHPPAWLKAAGYWTLGEADAHGPIGD